jgi:ABC-type transport system involved in cytochrome c biogenesis permease subunit
MPKAILVAGHFILGIMFSASAWNTVPDWKGFVAAAFALLCGYTAIFVYRLL